MASVNPYLNFAGTCEAAFNYYKDLFGGEFTFVGRYKDMPPNEEMLLAESDKELIMHISLPLQGGTVLMGSDAGGEWAPNLIMGNNISISINTSSKAEADHCFSGLSDGGEVTMPIADTFWGDYFGMCIDRFGIPWMISFNEKTSQG